MVNRRPAIYQIALQKSEFLLIWNTPFVYGFMRLKEVDIYVYQVYADDDTEGRELLGESMLEILNLVQL